MTIFFTIHPQGKDSGLVFPGNDTAALHYESEAHAVSVKN